MWDINSDMSLKVPELFLVAIKWMSAANIKSELTSNPVKKENMTPTVSCFESCLDVPITNGKKSIGSFVFKSSNPSEKTSVLISQKNSIRKAVDNISGA